MNNPYLGILITLVSYLIGKLMAKKFKLPIFNPLLIGIILCILFMRLFNISYDEYRVGGDFVYFLIGPATVVLVVPLYKNINILMKNLIPVLVGIFIGSITAIVSVLILANLFNLDQQLKIILLPQSITTAIALPMAEMLGGIGAITAVAVSGRGVLGVVIAPTIFRIFNIKDPVAKGVAIGTTSHAAGTSKAIELGEVEGSISGLSIAIAGVITAIIIPLIINFV